MPGAIAERPEQLAQELVDSVLAGSGQFCTSPNLVLAFETPENKSQTESVLNQIAKSFSERPAQPLLSAAGRKQLHQGVTALTSAGAKLVTGGDNAPGDGYRYANTLLRATAAQFLAAPHDLQREIFGNAALAVTVNTEQELQSILRLLEATSRHHLIRQNPAQTTQPTTP
jgi:NADP-dependent aldehyde dehydrogenase